jgi:hypothetical protein
MIQGLGFKDLGFKDFGFKLRGYGFRLYGSSCRVRSCSSSAGRVRTPPTPWWVRMSSQL